MRKAGLRLLLLLLLPLLLFSFVGREASAAGSGKIILDNKELVLPSGIKIENTNGSVMIPIRVVVENLGFEVRWEQKSHKVTVTQDGKSVELAVGSKKANAGGVLLDLNAAPKQTGGTVLVPIRFVGEQFGLKVGWDNSDKTVYLSGATPVNNEDANISDGAGYALDLPVTTPDQTLNPSPSPAIDGSLAVIQQVKGAVFTENRLMVAVSGTVKPTVTTMNNPYRIVVDFPGTAFATDFISGAGAGAGIAANGSPQGKLDVTGYPQISEVRYALFSSNPSTVRFVIQMTSSSPYQVSTDDSSGLTTIDLNVPSTGTGVVGGSPTGKRVVVLDAGHGGSQPGAISVTKKMEKDFNLAVIRKAGLLLESQGNVTVILTRTEDTTLGLQDRVDIAEAAHADIFISLHANAMPSTYPNWDKVNGSETYYSRSESIPLAEIMHKHLVAGTGFKDNGKKSKSLHVTRETKMPAVLLEAGYLTNINDEAALFSEFLQDHLAREIVAGINEYLGL